MQSVRSPLAKRPSKAPTGITGFDEITGGGLPHGRTTLLVGGPGSGKIISTIFNLAHSLKLKVGAEGVESEEQSRLLRLLNCDEIQGYFFCKPVPAEIFEAKFLARSPAG